MLKIYENSTPSYPLHVEDDAWYIEHKYNGNDILKFEIPDTHKCYKHIEEETRISDGSNLYTVKAIDEHGGYVNVDCHIDLDDWRAGFWKSFRTTDSTLQQVLNKIMPTGWSVSGAESITKRTTIEASEGKRLENVTAEDILKKASDAYEAVFNFDALKKKLRVIDPNKYVSSGEYFTDELNLKSIGYVGKSTDFATRLYAYGKKDSKGRPVTFAGINGGKEFIEDRTYSTRVISIGWSDERYTIPKNLLDAAKKKLAELAFPVRSYECDVRNIDEDMYMYKVVTLVDRKRKKRVEHKAIEYKEYPRAHHLDVVTLSAISPRIESSMRTIKAEIKAQDMKAQQVMTDAVLDAMNTITGANGGHITIEIIDGVPEAIKVLHTDGTITTLDQDGLHRNDEKYYYLGCSGAAAVNVDTGMVSVQLPTKITGKDTVATATIQKITPMNVTDVLQSLEISHTCGGGMLNIVCNCKMVNITTGEQVKPKELIISYSIIGR